MIGAAPLLAWSALALMVTLTPGPDTLLVVAHAARNGLRAGLAALAGVMLGVAWYGVLIGFGLISVLVAVPPLFLAVKIAGALYLAWLGAQMLWRALRFIPPPQSGGGKTLAPASGGEGASPAPPSPLSPRNRGDSSPARGGAELVAIRQGFFTNALNPKVALFYAAALPQFAGSGPDAPLIGVILLAIHALFAVVWLAFVALATARARGLVWNRSAARWLEGAAGAFFLGVAGRLAWTQR